jgi:hypothetical protein
MTFDRLRMTFDRLRMTHLSGCAKRSPEQARSAVSKGQDDIRLDDIRQDDTRQGDIGDTT